MSWSKGRGRLGFLQPLIGEWAAESETPYGTFVVTRNFSRFGSAYVRVDARWDIPKKSYEELALFGVDADGTIRYWSFTSDGKQSVGERVASDDLPPGAFAVESQMPAGLARQIYFPIDDDPHAFGWAVESRTKKGWNRFTEHIYRRA